MLCAVEVSHLSRNLSLLNWLNRSVYLLYFMELRLLIPVKLADNAKYGTSINRAV